MTKKATLTSLDWIKAGFRALAADGVKAIRAEALSRDLGVSKGSFYWHFKDVPTFHAQMLDHWANAATFATIETIDKISSSPKDQLIQLIKIATSEPQVSYGGPGVEMAIRTWGLHDPKVGALTKRVEGARLDYLEQLFVQAGHTPTDSVRNARLIYAALIGLQHFETLNNSAPQNDLLALLEILLSTTNNA